MSEFTDVPAGKIAAVVTYLEMRTRPRHDGQEPALQDRIRRIEKPDPDWYLDVYNRIGADLLWFSRLVASRDKLVSTITDPNYEVCAVNYGDQEEGLVELDFRTPGACELAFFGVCPQLVGKGVGLALMQYAIQTAWAHPIERFWVHTCTLDHPNALPFYLRCGFRAYKREIEIADDPRLSGALPETAAPQVPVIKP